MIFVVVVPGEPPKVVEEEGNPLALLQKHVGGYIETVGRLGLSNGTTLDAYANDDLTGLAPNCCTDYGLIHGTVVITGADEDGETVSLSPRETAAALRWAMSWPRVVAA